MKLYKVKIEYETVIRAESEQEAESNAEYIIRNDADDPASEISGEEITKIEELPHGWNEECRPWGERDPLDRTIGEMLK